MDFSEIKIEKLNMSHSSLVKKFTCVETDTQLIKHNSSERRKIKKHSKEMDKFFQKQALKEQNQNLNSTYLFIKKEDNVIVGFVSVCADSIPIEKNEVIGISYDVMPALKIARLATSSNYVGEGIGTWLIKYAIEIFNNTREKMGIKFITLDCYKHRFYFYEKRGFIPNIIQSKQLAYDSPISLRLDVDEFLHKEYLKTKYMDNK